MYRIPTFAPINTIILNQTKTTMKTVKLTLLFAFMAAFVFGAFFYAIAPFTIGLFGGLLILRMWDYEPGQTAKAHIAFAFLFIFAMSMLAFDVYMKNFHRN